MRYIPYAYLTNLKTIDASGNSAGVMIEAQNIKPSVDVMTIIGTSAIDTITGTNQNDIIIGGGMGDTITLKNGNDIVKYTEVGQSSEGAMAFDIITDFAANTVSNSANTGAGIQSAWDGDVLQFLQNGTGAGGVVVGVSTNAMDAENYLIINMAANTVVAALDKSTGNLYVDNTSDGFVDYFIHLTGVTNITAAAFLLVDQ